MASRAKDSSTGTSLEDLSAMIREGELKELKVIIKGDVQGSVEALRESFGKVGNAEVAVKVIHSAVGGITESDVNLAASSENGVVIGFNVRPDPRANEMAEKYGVKILTFSIIYDAIDRIRQMLEGMLAPIIEESSLGRAEVRETYTSPKSGTIAGCYVTEGLLRRNARARLLRNNKVIVESNISSLRRFKDDVKEVRSGYECGLSLHNFNDIKIGDVVEVYELKEVAAKL
jgi:translation initiation factor IF-2